MGKVLSAGVLDGLITLSKKVDVGVIAIGDKTGYPVIFASHLEGLLGYKPDEIQGRTFARILPLSIRGRHKQLMEGFKLQVDSGTSRDMTPGRSVKGLHKDGSEVDLSIAISYHPALMPDERGVFLALVQDPLNMKADDRQLKNLRVDFNTLVYSGKQMTQAAKRAIAAKITASGGMLGFIIWLMTQITPLGTALRSFWAAWNWKTINPNATDVQIASGVNDKERYRALEQIRDTMRDRDPRVVAVGYYDVIDVGFNEVQLRYLTDSNSPTGQEVWFFDKVENKLVLTSEESRKLALHECFIKTDGAEWYSKPSKPKLNLILCPTVQINSRDRLKQLTRANVMAVAVEKPFNDLEPLATILWSYSPAVENIIK